MKVRVIGLVLAAVVIVSATLTAFAATAEDEREAPVVVVTPPSVPLAPSVEVEEEETAAEPAEPETPFYMDEEPMGELVYQVWNNAYYVTMESFATSLDRETVVEEEDGNVTVTAATVTQVVDVEAEKTNLTDSAVSEANMEEETLNLSAKDGAYYVQANGRYLYVEAGVISVEGKIALPIRVLAKVYNLDVTYDAQTRRVHLNSREGASAYLEDADSFYDSETLYWLSHIIYAESGNQCLEGKLAVGNVVMNRVEHPEFPDTIYEVLFQKNQFSPAGSGSIYRDPNEQSIIAAKLVLDGAEVLEDALFFNRAGMNTRAARNRPFVATIGAHSFYA